mmetsp:Transcript_74839/g.243042  ORF Transcript_74839/g.243042 Transcript_74839/m.243042 type:complete len:220 (+) Transcript_74839:2066-2725(+)
MLPAACRSGLRPWASRTVVLGPRCEIWVQAGRHEDGPKAVGLLRGWLQRAKASAADRGGADLRHLRPPDADHKNSDGRQDRAGQDGGVPQRLVRRLRPGHRRRVPLVLPEMQVQGQSLRALPGVPRHRSDAGRGQAQRPLAAPASLALRASGPGEAPKFANGLPWPAAPALSAVRYLWELHPWPCRWRRPRLRLRPARQHPEHQAGCRERRPRCPERGR